MSVAALTLSRAGGSWRGRWTAAWLPLGPSRLAAGCQGLPAALTHSRTSGVNTSTAGVQVS